MYLRQEHTVGAWTSAGDTLMIRSGTDRRKRRADRLREFGSFIQIDSVLSGAIKSIWDKRFSRSFCRSIGLNKFLAHRATRNTGTANSPADKDGNHMGRAAASCGDESLGLEAGE
jgi:hypothetical protein